MAQAIADPVAAVIPEELMRRWSAVQPGLVGPGPGSYSNSEPAWFVRPNGKPWRLGLADEMAHNVLSAMVKRELGVRVPYWSVQWARDRGFRAIARRTTDVAAEPLLGAHALECVALLQVLVDLLESPSGGV